MKSFKTASTYARLLSALSLALIALAGTTAHAGETNWDQVDEEIRQSTATGPKEAPVYDDSREYDFYSNPQSLNEDEPTPSPTDTPDSATPNSTPAKPTASGNPDLNALPANIRAAILSGGNFSADACTRMQIHVFLRPSGLGISKEFGAVEIDGHLVNVFVISSAEAGKSTITGDFTLQIQKVHGSPYPWHTSSSYGDSPMYWGLQIDGGYWIHSTPHYNQLGRPASMGCVRVDHPTAMELWDIAVNRAHNSSKISIYKGGSKAALAAFLRLKSVYGLTSTGAEALIDKDLADAHAITTGTYDGNGHWRQTPNRVLKEFAKGVYPLCAGKSCFSRFGMTPRVNN